jgi:hypothetical protein
VHPLVVRPLPQQRMRLQLGEREWLLADFSTPGHRTHHPGLPGFAPP